MFENALGDIGALLAYLGLFGVGFGWLGLRTSDGEKSRERAALVFQCGVGAFGSSIVLASVRDGGGIAALLIGAAATAIAVILAKGMAFSGRSHSGNYGTSRWASVGQLDDRGWIGKEGLRLGLMGQDNQPLQYTGEKHLMTVAPTRGGKGVSAIIPNLLTFPGSVLVIDPKGENAMLTAKRRREMGQRVHVLDPWGTTGLQSAQFNPIDWLVHSGDDIIEHAMMLADAMVVPTEGGNAFFDQEARSLLMGLLLYVATDPEERQTRHLGRIRDLLSQDPDDMQDLYDRMHDADPKEQPGVATIGAQCKQKNPKTMSEVLASAQTQTQFLDSPRLRMSLNRSHFRFSDLKEKPTSIYLVLPADRIETFHRWFRLLVQQALMECGDQIDKPGARPESATRVLFLLDEMPALGKLKMIETAMGLAAGFRIQIWNIVQNLSQLENTYGKGWETFLANAGVIQYFGSSDNKSNEYFSKQCGKTTVSTQNRSKGSSSTWQVWKSSSNKSINEGEAQRPLIFPDELRTLPEDEQVLLVDNVLPIRARRIKYYEDPELSQLADT